MKILNAIGDLVLFGWLASLSLLFGAIFFSLREASNENFISFHIAGAFPIAVVLVLVSVVKYGLWQNRLFGMLAGSSALIVFLDAQNWTLWQTIHEVRIGGALLVAALSAPVFAVPLWQLIMAVSWAARTLKGR